MTTARASNKPGVSAGEAEAGVFQRRLSILAGQVDLAVDRVFHQKFDLNNTEWQVLAALNDGQMTFKEVVERCAMDKARVSRAQKRLIDRGFMRSVSHAEDGRKVILNLTVKGRRLAEEMALEIQHIESWVLGGLSREEQATLLEVLAKLMGRSLGSLLEARQPIRRPRADI